MSVHSLVWSMKSYKSNINEGIGVDESVWAEAELNGAMPNSDYDTMRHLVSTYDWEL